MRYYHFVLHIFALLFVYIGNSVAISQNVYLDKKDYIDNNGKKVDEKDVFHFFEYGNSFYKGCESKGILQQASTSYVIGLVDAVKLAKQFGSSVDICLPNGVTGKQMLDIVCKDMSLYPNMRNAPASYIAITALEDAFPCNKAK